MGLCARFLLGSWLGSWLGCVGVVGVLGFALFDVFLGGVGCWIVGIWGWGVGFAGGVFRFGDKHFGATYHLRDECHIFNIFGVTVRGE